MTFSEKFLIFGALGIAAAGVSSASSCGKFRAVGVLNCASEQISVLVFPKTRSERKIELDSAPEAYKKFCGRSVELNLRIAGSPWEGSGALHAKPLDAVPRDALVSGTVKDLSCSP